MSKETEELPPLPEEFDGELPPPPPPADAPEETIPLPSPPADEPEDDTPLPPPPADEPEDDIPLPPPPVDEPEDDIPLPPPPRKHTTAIVCTVALAALAGFNGVKIWQSYQEKSQITTQAQNNEEATQKAMDNAALNKKRFDEVGKYGPRLAELSVMIEQSNIEHEELKAISKKAGEIKAQHEQNRARRDALQAQKNELLGNSRR